MSKPRPNSPLKTQTEDRQREIIDYMLKHTLMETRAWLQEDGLNTSTAALSQFWSWWHLRQGFEELEADTQNFADFLKQARPDLDEAGMHNYAQQYFTTKAIKLGDQDAYLAMTSAKHKAMVDVEKLKVEKERLQMDQQKFRRETCALFVEWFNDKRAREIVESGASRADQIKQLYATMFPEETQQ